MPMGELLTDFYVIGKALGGKVLTEVLIRIRFN